VAGRIPQDFIDDLIERVDIADVIGSRVQLKKAGREYKAPCPFHSEKTPSFTVSSQKGFYHCFGCGAHGTAISFLMEFDRLEFPDAVEELAQIAGVPVPRDDNVEKRTPLAPVHEVLHKAAGFYRQALKENPTATDYLKSRGLDGETVRAFGIGFAPASWDFLLRRFGDGNEMHRLLKSAGLIVQRDNGGYYDRFRDRVMFPIRDSRGRVIGFGGRVIGDGEPKYLNSPETPAFHKGRELYGLYEARQAQRKLDRVLVVEGYMDVVSLACQGIQNAVGTLGTATTPEHLRRLFRASAEIVFCFDGDRAGRAAAWRALQTSLPEMRDGRQVRFMFLPDGEDPDSLVRHEGKEGLSRRLQTTVTLSDYLLQELETQTDMDSMDGRARLAELARPGRQSRHRPR
jgi:DNA primase